MKNIISVLFVAASVLGGTFTLSANAADTNAVNVHSTTAKDAGHWRTNSETGEKTWVSGEEDQKNVNEAICGNPLLSMLYPQCK